MEIDEIRNATDFLSVSYDADDKTLFVRSDFSPYIVDSNFAELDSRLTTLSDDRIISLENRVAELERIVNDLNQKLEGVV